MADFRRESLKLEDSLIKIISHELRGPLTSILGWVELIKSRTNTDNLTSEGIDAIERSASEMSRMLQVISSYGDSLNSAEFLRKEYLNLVDTIEDVSDRLASEGIRVHVTVHEPDAILFGDSERLEQALFILGKRAVEACQPHCTLSLSSTSAEDGMVVTFRTKRDNADQSVSNGVRQVKPSVIENLEMETARSILMLHQASIRTNENEAGFGSEFTITLPFSGVSPQLTGKSS